LDLKKTDIVMQTRGGPGNISEILTITYQGEVRHELSGNTPVDSYLDNAEMGEIKALAGNALNPANKEVKSVTTAPVHLSVPTVEIEITLTDTSTREEQVIKFLMGDTISPGEDLLCLKLKNVAQRLT
jgi:hypothetical protein